MRVYVITQGQYSDYHICGVTANKAAAEKVVEHLNSTVNNDWYSAACIEEFDTDIWESGKQVWVYTLKEDGRDFVYEDGYADVTKTDGLYSIKKLKNNTGTIYTVYILANDEDHARKIGRDIFSSYRAQEEGIT